MRLAWGAKVSPLFRERLLAMCVRLGIDDPNDMMACIAFETGRKFTSDVVNAASGATGLIQFMPSTARAMGTTTEYLASLSPEDQLEWVERYFRDHQRLAGRMHSLDDVYMGILWPKGVGKLLNWPLFSKDDADSRAYFGNKGLDVNADGVVTKGEATAYVQKQLNDGLAFGNWTDEATGIAVDTSIQPAPIPAPPAAPKPPQTPDLTPYRSPESAMPLVSLLMTLLPQILNGFSPAGQAQAKPILGQPIEQLAPLLLNLFSMIGGKVGAVPEGQPVTTDAQAIATVAEFNRLKETNAGLVAEIEQSALNRLKIIAPMVDKLMDADKMLNEARIAGMDAAANRAAKERWDMTPWLVWIAGGTATVLVLSLLGAIIWQATTGDKKIDTALIGLAGPLLAIAMGVWREIHSYRWDGTPSTNAANLINAEIAATRAKKV
jgi:hypothetical protein